MAARTKGAEDVTLLAGDVAADDAATIASGVLLRSYNFDRYKSRKRPEGAEQAQSEKWLLP